MEKEVLKRIENEVFQFDFENSVDNTTKTDEEINEKYL